MADGGTDNSGDMLRETAGRLFADFADPGLLARAMEGGVMPDGLWPRIEESGLTAALLPEAAGGYGVTPADALSLVRIAGQHALPAPFGETLLARALLALAGMPVVDGPASFAIADAPFRRDGDGWRIEATLSRVPWASAVDTLLVAGDGMLARLDRGMFATAGGRNLAGEPRDTVTVATRVAADRVGRLPLDARELRALGAALRTQAIAGALEHVCALTIGYAQDRVQFGRPIGKFQAIQHSLAQLAEQAAAAVAAAAVAGDAVELGRPPRVALPSLAAAKIRAGEAAGIGAGFAHQVHGAIGFTAEYSLHLWTKRLWSWRDEFGGEAEWSLYYGRHLAAQGADRLWAELTAA